LRKILAQFIAQVLAETIHQTCGIDILEQGEVSHAQTWLLVAIGCGRRIGVAAGGYLPPTPLPGPLPLPSLPVPLPPPLPLPFPQLPPQGLPPVLSAGESK
jgi:hypothetical protein